MSRTSNVVQIQNVERLQFSHVLIPYLNGYIKAVTLGFVFICSTSIICSTCPRVTCICAGSSEPCLLIDALTADISSILQALQKKITFFNVFKRVYI